jgi:hypothetical protein
MSGNSDKDARLAEDDFRARRLYLPNDAFALSEGSWGPPTDQIPEETWQELINLPTDVLLRTTDRRGRAIAQLTTLWSTWIKLLPVEAQRAPFMFDAAWDAADDFNVSIFVTVHGYYRQGMANLRSVLEGIAIAATFAIRQDAKALRKWLEGQSEPPKFGNMRDMLKPSLGLELTAVLELLHKKLSKHVHAGCSGSNAVLERQQRPDLGGHCLRPGLPLVQRRHGHVLGTVAPWRVRLVHPASTPTPLRDSWRHLDSCRGHRDQEKVRTGQSA